MISLEMVENDIAELEKRDTCFATCERLAWLYIVRDHLRTYSPKNQEPLAINGESDFLKAVNGKNTDGVWEIMNEVMDAVKVLHPKMYERIILEIQDL